MKNVLTSHHVITGAVKSFEPISLEPAMFSKTSKYSMTQSSKWSSLTARRHHTYESRALRPRIIQLVTQILAKKIGETLLRHSANVTGSCKMIIMKS